MSWKLYLDDIRKPPYDGFVLAESAEEAIKLIEVNGCPEFISFDHDLALDHYAPVDPRYRKPSECATGYDFAHWLVAEDIRRGGKLFPENFKFYVHSSNPVGKENIEKLLESYFRFKKDYKR